MGQRCSLLPLLPPPFAAPSSLALHAASPSAGLRRCQWHAVPSPTLSPTGPVPRGLLTLWARAGPVYAYMYVCVHAREGWRDALPGVRLHAAKHALELPRRQARRRRRAVGVLRVHTALHTDMGLKSWRRMRLGALGARESCRRDRIQQGRMRGLERRRHVCPLPRLRSRPSECVLLGGQNVFSYYSLGYAAGGEAAGTLAAPAAAPWPLLCRARAPCRTHVCASRVATLHLPAPRAWCGLPCARHPPLKQGHAYAQGQGAGGAVGGRGKETSQTDSSVAATARTTARQMSWATRAMGLNLPRRSLE